MKKEGSERVDFARGDVPKSAGECTIWCRQMFDFRVFSCRHVFGKTLGSKILSNITFYRFLAESVVYLTFNLRKTAS